MKFRRIGEVEARRCATFGRSFMCVNDLNQLSFNIGIQKAILLDFLDINFQRIDVSSLTFFCFKVSRWMINFDVFK